MSIKEPCVILAGSGDMTQQELRRGVWKEVALGLGGLSLLSACWVLLSPSSRSFPPPLVVSQVSFLGVVPVVSVALWNRGQICRMTSSGQLP